MEETNERFYEFVSNNLRNTGRDFPYNDLLKMLNLNLQNNMSDTAQNGTIMLGCLGFFITFGLTLCTVGPIIRYRVNTRFREFEDSLTVPHCRFDNSVYLYFNQNIYSVRTTDYLDTTLGLLNFYCTRHTISNVAILEQTINITVVASN